jgi:LmbE family N-acetylglucosaminyl deacetylase
MKFTEATAEIWVPDGAPERGGLGRVTHMGIAAHPDDIEIMCLDGILDCFGKADRWFMAAIVTNGATSPRSGQYANYTDEQMKLARRIEQKKAAFVGEYSAVAFLDHATSSVTTASNSGPKTDLTALLAAAKPQIVYTHNLADKHDAHVAVTLRVIAAIRDLPPADRPKKLYGCEVWRDLDWLVDSDKIVFQLDQHENIAASLLGVFDSQIAGGKRYDLATLGRRRAHATYHQKHSIDAASMINFGMDLTPLVHDNELDPSEYVARFIRRFSDDVSERITRFS